MGGHMKKVITYGTYDMLHFGHIRLLERAKALGDYLIVGVTSESYDKMRGKINVKQSLNERIDAVKGTGLADEIIVEEYEGQKIDDIHRYGVDIFTIGSDWEGKFDYLNEYCKVVYLDRTTGVSSTILRNKELKINFGLMGDFSNDIIKFSKESKYVNGIYIRAVYTKDKTVIKDTPLEQYEYFESFSDFVQVVDAVYVVTNFNDHFEQIKYLLEAGKHVLCESPITLSTKELDVLYKIAQEHNCILMESIKTAYSLAFSRLQLIAKSEFIGNVISVDATCTSLSKDKNSTIEPDSQSSIYLWGPYALLPVFSILGTEYRGKSIYTRLTSKGADEFTRINFQFKNAVASVTVANGVKSEGELVISGTKGYIYVPSPWWKTDYFEIRYENPQDNRRYFYPLEGEGIRYMIVNFLKSIKNNKSESYIPQATTYAISEIMHDFSEQINTVVL